MKMVILLMIMRRGLFHHPLTYNEASKTLTIGKREGSFNGMLTNRTFNIVWINKNSNRALEFDKKPDATIQYNGDAVSIKMKK